MEAKIPMVLDINELKGDGSILSILTFDSQQHLAC